MTTPTLIWEWPVRVFHWTLVLLVIALYVTVEMDQMTYHKWCGITVLALVTFRIVWGFIGGTYARFGNFLKSPAAVARYVASLPRRDTPPHVGHNPLGGLSVVAMLLALLFQAGTGLFSTDDVIFEGPLYSTVSSGFAESITGWHKWNFNVLLALIGLHIAAVLFYLRYKRENLIVPMITGRKNVDAPGTHYNIVRLVIAIIPAVAVAVVLLNL